VVGRKDGLFSSDQVVSGDSGSGNNWAVGYFEHGEERGEEIMEGLRKEVETCDALGAILSLYSAGGGTGSGLGTWIGGKIAEKYPEACKFACIAMPSGADDVVTSPYNRFVCQ
jgi:tubulin epsilon